VRIEPCTTNSESSPVPSIACSGTRRILLKGTRDHHDYVMSETDERVLPVEQAQPGGDPPLRTH
jgi:hypothetical protein